MSLEIEASRDFVAYGYHVDVDPEAVLRVCELAAGEAPIHTLPSVYIQPGRYFGMSVLERAAMDNKLRSRGIKPAMRVVEGEYELHSNHVAVVVQDNARSAERSLSHEVFHWAEDMVLGTLERDMLAVEAKLGKQPTTWLTSDWSLATHLRYRRIPYERRARQFATSRQVKALTGQMVRFTKLS